jgi:hypothetical protein
MPDSNLARVAAWLAEEERKKRDGVTSAPASQPNVVDRAYAYTPYGVRSVEFTDSPSDSLRAVTDPTGVPDPTTHRFMRAGDLRRMEASWDPSLNAPKGKLPFISGTPTHEATKPAFAYMPTVARIPGDDMQPKPLQRSYAGMMDAVGTSAPTPPTKPNPKATLAKARGRKQVDVKMTTEGVQPQFREPVDPLAARGSAPELPSRVSTYLQGRRAPSGLEDAQRLANVNQLSANLGRSAEFLGAGIGGSRARPEAFDNLQEQAGQPVTQYQQRHAEERQQEQDDLALAEADREATRAAEEMEFRKGRATSEDQLARDRMAQDREMNEARLQSEAADRGLRREEMTYRQKEGQELKQQLADQRQWERQTREDELDLQRLGTATSKAPFGEFQAALEEIDRQIPGLAYGQTPKEAPLGVGDRIARSLAPVGGEFFMSDKGKAYSTAIANLRDLVARMRSGAVLNAGEERHYLSLLGDRVLSDERTAAQGINAVRQGIAQKLRNAQGGYQNVLPRYEATGATTYRAHIFGAAPTGEEIQMPNGEVYEVLSDGTTRRRP